MLFEQLNLGMVKFKELLLTEPMTHIDTRIF